MDPRCRYRESPPPRLARVVHSAHAPSPRLVHGQVNAVLSSARQHYSLAVGRPLYGPANPELAPFLRVPNILNSQQQPLGAGPFGGAAMGSAVPGTVGAYSGGLGDTLGQLAMLNTRNFGNARFPNAHMAAFAPAPAYSAGEMAPTSMSIAIPIARTPDSALIPPAAMATALPPVQQAIPTSTPTAAALPVVGRGNIKPT